MRPVTVNQNPGYQVPTEMRTNTTAIRKGLQNNGVYPIRGQTIYDTEAVLDVLDTLTMDNMGTDKWAGLNTINQALVVGLTNYFTTNDSVKYGNARGALIDNFGQFCSYCGMPVQDSALAVEHCLPKAQFPGYMLSYTNFFLSCPSCNSYKGSEPSFNAAKKWAQRTNGIPDFGEIVDGGYGRQVWPDEANAYTGFIPSLINAVTGLDIPLQDAISLNNVIVGSVQNSVQASIQGFNNPIIVATRFRSSSSDPTEKEREGNFIDIVRLNDFDSTNYSDRRVTNRTMVWLTVLSSLNLIQVAAPTPGTPQWQAMLTQMFMVARSSGYFEIWAYVLYTISPPSVKDSIYMSFCAAATNPANPLLYFTGTDAAALPKK